jgi:hypothetical protein
MSIEVHIERLVMEGFALSGHEAAAVRLALEQELGRLLGETGAASPVFRSGAAAAVRGGEIRAPSVSKPAQFGEQIAGAVLSGLGGRR